MSTFVSVYLFVYADSLIIMALYIIIRIGLFPVSFILGSKIAKKVPFTVTYAMGLTLITCSLIYALLGAPLFQINKYYVLITAFITGIGEGFYYFSSNTCNQIVSTAASRARFLSANGVFNNISCLLAPFVANLIINFSNNDMEGYKRILYLTIIIFILVIIISLSINKKSDDKDIPLLNSFKIKDDEMWRDHQLGIFYYGLMNSLSLILVSILIYNAAGTGNTYSQLQTIFALICVLSYRLIMKKLKRENLPRTFKIGYIIKASSTIVLVLFPNMFGAIYYGIVNAISSALYDNSYNLLSASIIGHYHDEMTARVVARETVLSFGRCVGMGFIILCNKVLPENLYLQVSVILLSLTPVFVYKKLIKYN